MQNIIKHSQKPYSTAYHSYAEKGKTLTQTQYFIFIATTPNYSSWDGKQAYLPTTTIRMRTSASIAIVRFDELCL